MKKITFILFLIPAFALCQSIEQNYIRSTDYKVPTLDGITATDGSGTVTPQKKAVNVTYFDGLGRPMQQVAHRQSGTGMDIVTPISYDVFGRQDKDYLPLPATTNNMLFTSNTIIIGDPASYYTNNYGDDGAYRYSEKLFEASPLSRVLEQGAPGESWAVSPTSDVDHTIKFEYKTNESLTIRRYDAVATWNATTELYDIAFANPEMSVFYLAGQLYMTITKDENWTSGQLNTIEEYKNKLGQVVLKRTFSTINNTVTPHDTYYVYDQFSNLTYVIPPLATGNIASMLSELCYQYKYDSRNRLVEKKLPGKQWEFIVYDNLDRVVATGPANSPFTNLGNIGWLVTKYDAFNRPVLTAWLPSTTVNTSGRKTLQNDRNLQTTNFNESRSASDNSEQSIPFRYTKLAWPTSGFHTLTVNYYDDYNYTGAPTGFSLVLDTAEQVYYNNSTQKPKGLATGSWVRVLTTSTSTAGETSYSLYDRKSRPVRVYTRNHLGGYTYVDTKLDFAGKTLYTTTYHRRLSGGGTETIIREDFTYNDQDRLLTHTHKINGLATELITKNEYYEMGQLKNKRVGGPALTPTGLQKVDYTYNIRGWLTEINKIINLTQVGDPVDLFGFKLNYNTVENNADNSVKQLYNGNISETFWRTSGGGDNLVRKYGYVYDEMNRLRDAIYQKPDLNNPSLDLITDAYNETIAYDKNGNILSLQRTGYLDAIDGQPYQIDNLVYTYDQNSNKLRTVTDLSNSADGFRNGANPDADYGYDANGNMTFDLNKNIVDIAYNHLNLPVKVTFSLTGENRIDYIYNALGIKVAKTVVSTSSGVGTTAVATDYLGAFQYINTVLHLLHTAEGYVSVTNGDRFDYVYNYKDHLGNIRLSYSKPSGGALTILEENHYYPFGMKHINYGSSSNQYDHNPDGSIYAIIRQVERNKYQYKYNGKEFQDELGLNVYDYGARMYDPAIGRWPCIDPQAELLERSSPYVYALNSPLVYVDNDGELPILINGKTTSDAERADVSYWTASIVNTIKNSGIANPGGDVHYVDGNRGHSWSGRAGGYATKDDNVLAPSRRAQGGRYAADGDWKTILSKLARDTETGKIIEKIQIYTHSRGAAFGVGYTERLLELIKENSSQFADANNVIDFVYNMAPHQSDFLTAPDGVDSYSMDHDRDKLSDNDMEGVKGAFSSREKSKGFFGAHSITSFQNDLKAFTSSFLKGGTSQDVINNFVKTMKEKYGVTVTVK